MREEPVAQPPAPTCRDHAGRDPLATFVGSGCPFVLVGSDDRLTLASLEPEPPPPATGKPPGPCETRPCDYEGLVSSAGPLLVAIERSPASEMPDGVHLGLVAAERIAFVDLWAGGGQGVTSDSTDLGPAHALAPFLCPGGELGLFAVGRLNAAKGTKPPPELRKREGTYAFDGDTLARSDGERARCEEIPLDGVL